LKAVIFDMDGVLIDSEPLHLESDLLLLGKYKVDVPEHYLEKYVGTTGSSMWEEIRNEFGIETELQEILNAALSLKLKLLKKGSHAAIDGIPELLKDLHAKKILVGVASSSPSMFIKEVLKRIGVERYVDTWISGENVDKGKPEPDIFLRMAELFGVEPSQCVVVEDSRNGVLAARRAGMKCIGFRNPNSGNQDIAKADLVIEGIGELSEKSIRALCDA